MPKPFRVLPDLPPEPLDLFRVLAGWYIFSILNILRATKKEERDELFQAALADLNVSIGLWWEAVKEKYDRGEVSHG
jgi:hypothetical protein